MTSKKKKYVLRIPEELYKEIVQYQRRHNLDYHNVGVTSVNNLFLTAMKQFLVEN
jgi:hypothetical protein